MRRIRYVVLYRGNSAVEQCVRTTRSAADDSRVVCALFPIRNYRELLH